LDIRHPNRDKGAIHWAKNRSHPEDIGFKSIGIEIRIGGSGEEIVFQLLQEGLSPSIFSARRRSFGASVVFKEGFCNI
jgi:hypothetical protein